MKIINTHNIVLVIALSKQTKHHSNNKSKNQIVIINQLIKLTPVQGAQRNLVAVAARVVSLAWLSLQYRTFTILFHHGILVNKFFTKLQHRF